MSQRSQDNLHRLSCSVPLHLIPWGRLSPLTWISWICSILPLFSHNTGATRHVPARRCAAPFRALRQVVESDFRALHLRIAATLTHGALFPSLLGVLFQQNKLHQDEDIYSGNRKLNSPLNLKQHWISNYSCLRLTSGKEGKKQEGGSRSFCLDSIGRNSSFSSEYTEAFCWVWRKVPFPCHTPSIVHPQQATNLLAEKRLGNDYSHYLWSRSIQKLLLCNWETWHVKEIV